MKHADRTPCAGEGCAWKNSGGHEVIDDVLTTADLTDPFAGEPESDDPAINPFVV